MLSIAFVYSFSISSIGRSVNFEMVFASMPSSFIFFAVFCMPIASPFALPSARPFSTPDLKVPDSSVCSVAIMS